jgi:galactokinase
METNERKQRLRSVAVKALDGIRSADIAGCFFVPGRIEVLGKHTDYAGGRSLLAAVDRGFVVVAAPRPDGVVRVIDAATGESVEFDGASGDVVTPGAHAVGGSSGVAANEARDARAPGWSTYPQTVVRRCALNFRAAAGGADIAFASDLPQAAGLSSSSALVVAVFLALDAVRSFSGTQEYRVAIESRDDLAGYLGAVENGLSFRALAGDKGVGTMGGSEDHTAILCARPGRLVQYSYAPVRFEGDAAMPPGYCFAIASSGVRAEKAGAALQQYNRLSVATRRLVELWREHGAGDADTLADIVAADTGAPRLREIVHRYAPAEANELLPRLAQFAIESEEIVPAARAALARGDLPAFAEHVRRSQHHAEESLLNQIPETVALVEAARTHGAVAASAFGAGFGGSVWALVSEDGADAFLASWEADYAAAFSERGDAEFFVTGASGPAERLE